MSIGFWILMAILVLTILSQHNGISRRDDDR